MEFVGGAVSAVIAVVKYAAKPVKRHVGYLFRFNSNGEDLGKAKKDLILQQQKVEEAIERATLNTEVVEKDVEDWLKNVEEIVKDLETLENKIQANKVCCKGWCPNLIQRYKQNKEAAKKTITVNKALKDTERFNQVAHRPPTPGLEIFSSIDFEGFESRKWAFDEIMEALRDDNSNMIGVWGMGGVGKTTLVKEVFKKAKALALFNDIAMAVVSQTPDITKIQNEIAGYLNLKLEEKDDSERARRICLRIRNSEKMLIVLDDVWKVNGVNFEDIGIPNDHKGCKILITTRSEHVCNVMSCVKKVQLKVMTKEESLALFKKSACIDNDSIAIDDDVVRQVVKECQGLPIAIVVVGKALIQRSLDEWYTTLKKLRESKFTEIDGVDEDKNAYVCLKLSYDYLKRVNKLCFLLCSLFPEDSNIRIEELVIYVIGLEEEYEEVKSNTEEVRRQVYAAINSLKDSSLLLDSHYGKDYVKMHDVVRDVALWIASKWDNEFSMRAYTSLKGISRFESVTAISLWDNNAKQFQDKLVCPKLNILLLGEVSGYYKMKNDELQEISDTMFEGMKGLKVLSLYNKFLSSQSLQFLTNLRSLYLVNCNFDDLCSLGKLKSLEILSFLSCRMVALPNELGGLNNLKVLQLLGCYRLERILPNLIQGLCQLEKLCVNFKGFKNWEVEGTCIERRNASLLELMSLSNLAVLDLTIEEKSLPIGFVFPELQRYKIYVGTGLRSRYYPQSYERVLGLAKVNASPSFNVFNVLFCTVEDLQLLDCQLQCFNDTMGGVNNATFSNLVKLTLGNCSSLTYLFSMSLVQNLKKLDTLILEGCSELKQIISEEELLFKRHQIQCFPKLRILRVIYCGKLKYLFSISVARDFLVQLEELTIVKLPQLKQVFGNEREGKVGLDGNKFELSKLRTLSLQELPELSNFFQGNTSSTWASLENLSMMSCPKISPSFVADLGASVQVVIKTYAISVGSYIDRAYKSRVLRCVDANASSLNMYKVFFCSVEELELEKCEVECFNDTTRGNNTVTFSNLVKLIMKGMPCLRTMWEGPIQQTTFCNLTVLEARNCNKLTNLFSPTLVQNLEKLEILILESCSELKQIISEDEMLFKRHHIQPPCFPKLRTLKVIDCKKLEYLFTISVARGFLLQLEEMIVEDLPELKQVFGDEKEGEVGLDGDKFELSELTELSLHKLPKLSSFCQGNISSTWPSLETLSVMSCPKMTPSFFVDLVASVEAIGKTYAISVGGYIQMAYNSKLRVLRCVDVDASSLNVYKVFFCSVVELELEKCEVECFNDTTGGNNIVTFSNLVKLIMKGMPYLRTMWEGPIQQTTFRNLTVLEARNCNKLTNLFSPTLVQNLVKLEILILESCSELKQIISEDEMLFKRHHIQPPCFPKLRTLKVIDCEKLEYLFTISVARGFLLQLEEMIVEDLPELKQVFGDEKEGEVGLDGDKFEISKLTKLSLHKLPKLSSFCQGNISSMWPSLETLSVISCPNMTSSFAADLSLSANLKTYAVSVGSYIQRVNNSKSRVLRCVDADASLLNVYKVFFCSVEELELEKCEVECFNDTTGGNNAVTFSNLVKLIMKGMPYLRTMWEGPIQQTTFRNLTVLEARNCNKLTNFFSSTLVQNLEKLEILILESCSELKQIILEDEMLFKCHHIQPPCFPKLRTLKVIDCGKLEYLCSISVARHFLLQLKELKMDDLPELKQVFGDEKEGEVGLGGDKFELSELTELSLHKLPKLSSFCQGSISSTWPSLETLSVMSCPKMTPSFLVDLAASVEAIGKEYTISSKSDPSDFDDSKVLILQDVDASSLNAFKVFFCTVEVLELTSCEIECFDDTTGENNIATFSNLDNLMLRDMPSLRTLWVGPIQHTTFHNLTFLRVYNCSELTNPLPLPLCQNLEKLETFELESCSELKQIISEDEMLFNCNIQPKLRTLKVIDCGKLEYLCSISVARHFLLQLKELKMDDLPELKQVFGDEKEGEVGLGGDKFELSELIELSLHKLPKLSSFCQGSISSTWPSLETLSVMSCPKMTPSFLVDLAASVEAIGKKYTISSKSDPSYYFNSKVLILDVVDASSLTDFKVFFDTVKLLQLSSCEIECFNDTIGGNNTATFSNLDNLTLGDMPSLRTLWEGPIQHTTFRNLTFLRVYNCSELTNPLPLSLSQNLKKLETLILESCSELKQIISEDEMLFNCHIQSECFPKLRTFKVIDCGKLEYLCSISVARCFLLQLKELTIEDLPELKQVFGSEREADIGLNEEKFELSKLTKLSLHKLPKLNSFCQGNISSTWPSLERLSVMSCPPSFVAILEANVRAIGKKLQAFNVSNCSQLCNTVLDLLTQGFLDLKELKIESCEELEDLFQRERLLPSSLKILSLKDLLVQRCVWKGPTQLVNLNNITMFEVFRCNRLRQLFSLYTLARSLQQLKYLTIEECDEMEHLIEEDEEDLILSEGHLQPLYFPKLTSVVVKECNKMKSLFPITIVHSLQQLWKLEVIGASHLVEVFAHEDERDVGVPKDISLPNLWELRLELLSSLVSFCPRNYHFILPNLEYLKVQSCPNMSTSFARTPNWIVHAIGEVTQLDEKDEPAMFITTHQLAAARPTSKDIDWDRYQKRDALPLFIEEPPK